jgi:malate/lactate dehydrogenase
VLRLLSPKFLVTTLFQHRLLSLLLEATVVSRYVNQSHGIVSHAVDNWVAQIVPLLSQSSHPLPTTLSTDNHEALIKRIQFGGDEVVKAKDGAGSATLSMAYAGAEFASKVLKALKGEKGIVAPSFVHLSADKAGGEALKKDFGQNIEYFSSRVTLGVRI